MSKVLEMRNKRAKAWEDAKKFLDEKRDEKGLLSAEDAAAYEKMEKDIDDMGRMIDTLERAEALDKAMAAPANDPVVNNPNSAKKKGFASDEYHAGFWNTMRARKGQPVISDALRIGEDADGGYLAPDEFERRIIKGLEEQGVMRSLATKISTSSGDRKIPMLTGRTTADWTDEEEAYHETDMKFGMVTLGAHKMTALTKVSEELLYDSAFDIEGLLAEDYARAVSELEEDSFLNGDGVGKPTGLLTGVTEGVTLTSATAITFDDMFDLYYSLKSPYRGRAVWLLNDQSVKLLRKLQDGNKQYIWQPAVTAGAPDTILGRPVYTSPFVPAATSGNKAVVFGDIARAYIIADRQRRSMRRLNELYATTGQVGFITMERVDGKLVLPEAVKVMTMG